MPRTSRSVVSVLGYALLGLLARGEQTGYELAQGLKDPVSFFWHAQHSQIYPELARLETLGLVQHTLVEQSERPDKKVYQLTTAGRQALRDWLETPTDTPKTRDELVLKMYSMWLADPALAAAGMQDHVRIHKARLEEYEARLEHLHEKFGVEIWNPNSRWFGVHAVLRRGIGFEREYLEWCRWMSTSLTTSTS